MKVPLLFSTLSLSFAFPLPSYVPSSSEFPALWATKKSSIAELMDQHLFPPQNLQDRIALSRKDGYWPFISTGEDPPQEFVYGEFDLDFFLRILERVVLKLLPESDASAKDLVFCDLGSGTGRLVFTAAAAYPWKLCRGVELLPGIHQQAIEKLKQCQASSGRDVAQKSDMTSMTPAPMATATSTVPSSSSSSSHQDYWAQYQQYSTGQIETTSESPQSSGDDLWLPPPPQEQPEEETTEDATSSTSFATKSATDYALPPDYSISLAPIQLDCGSFEDPFQYFGDANIVFCFSSAMPQHVIDQMAVGIARQCLPGTIVVTTEYKLPLQGDIPFETESLPSGSFSFQLVEELHGECDATGGQSTAFVHRLVASPATGLPIEATVSDMAYKAVLAGENVDTSVFLRKISNQMAFLGIPDKWRPKLD